MKTRRLLALLLGTLFTLFLFEAVLRLTGAFERKFWQVEGVALKSNKPVVLFVGNSHTMGSGAPKEKSFPNQLAGRLISRGHGTMPFEFVNVGRGNANSTFIVDTLPGFLTTYRPQYVVVMTGETNQWNHYGFADFAAISSSPDIGSKLYDLAYQIRIFRFIQLFNEFVLKPRSSAVFSSQEEGDRALYWISALDLGNMFDISKMTKAEVDEARESVASFLKKHPDHLGALMTLADIELKSEETRASGFQFLRHAYEVGGGIYNFRIDRSLNSYNPDVGIQPDLAAWAKRLKDQRPVEYESYKELFEKLKVPDLIANVSIEKQVSFYVEAVRLNPTDSIARSVLYRHQLLANLYEDCIRTLIDGAELNPFANPTDWFAALYNLRNILSKTSVARSGQMIAEIDSALAEFKLRYPKHANPNSMISPSAIDRWLEADLEKIRVMVENSGAKLMLQTYMPEKSGVEKPADAVIRKFAQMHSIPLSDTSRYFFMIEPDKQKRQRFFTSWYGQFDNHLGENGYQVVAELLEIDFEKAGWLPPRP
ncbi:hypothetical protein BH10BDE1_BH10BDE1_04460 [soil metagenome]